MARKAEDIGPRIGIDGEAEFRRQLTNINQQLKTLGAEMKAVTSAFTGSDDAQKALTAQTEVLTRQIETQETKLAELSKMHEKAAGEFGELDNRTLQWAQQVYSATAALNKMKAQLSQTEQKLSALSNGADDAGEQVEDLGETAQDSSGGLDTMKIAAGNLLADGIQALISGIGDLISSLWNLDEATEEYRRNMGLLTTAFGSNGYGIETAKQSYKDLYAIIGDEGTATEAAQLMATLSQSQQDLSAWTEVAAGVWGTFGEALPINSLMEAANETAKVGTVTGVLADALNWAGISEDQFNATLASATTEADRNRIILSALSSTYSGAADAFYQNNDALVESREAQADMDETMADLGETIADIKTTLLTAFLPAIQQAADGAADFLEDVDAEAVANTILALVDAFIRLSPVIAAATTAMITYKAATTVAGVINKLTSSMSGATSATAAFNAVLNANPIVLIVTIVLSLVAALVTLIATNKDVRDGFLAVWDAITSAVGTAVDWIAEKIQAIKDAFSNLIDGVKDLLGIHSPSKVFRDIGENMAAGAELGWDSEWDKSRRQIEDGLDFSSLAAIPPQAQDPVYIQSIAAALETLIDTNEDVRNSFISVWGAINDAVGLSVDVISDKVQSIKDAFSGLIDGVKDLLGIHSPSRVFQDIGENMAAGAELGWDSEWDKSRRQIEGSLDFSDLLELSPQVQAPANVVYVNDKTPAPQGNGNAGGGVTKVFDITLELDGQTLAHKTYAYNEREGELRGDSLVEVGKK